MNFDDELGSAPPSGLGGATDTDEEYMFGGKADKLLSMKNVAFEGHGFESGFDTEDEENTNVRVNRQNNRETVCNTGKCRIIEAKKGDSPRYVDVNDKDLKSYAVMGTKIVKVKDRKYTISAHVKLTKVKFDFTQK